MWKWDKIQRHFSCHGFSCHRLDIYLASSEKCSITAVLNRRCNAEIVYLLKVLVEKVDSSIAFEALDAISFVVLAFLSFYYIL